MPYILIILPPLKAICCKSVTNVLSFYFEFITTDCALEPDHSLIIICIMFTKDSKFVCYKGAREKVIIRPFMCKPFVL